MFTSNVETQAEVTALCRLLRALPVDAVLTYDEAAGYVGRSVKTVARFSWLRAWHLVEKEDGVRFATVRNVGLKRLTAEEVPSIGSQARRQIHRKAGRASKRLRDLRGFNSVDPATQKQIDAELSALGAISLVTTERAVKKIHDEVTRAGSEVPVGRTLELFKK